MNDQKVSRFLDNLKKYIVDSTNPIALFECMWLYDNDRNAIHNSREGQAKKQAVIEKFLEQYEKLPKPPSRGETALSKECAFGVLRSLLAFRVPNQFEGTNNKKFSLESMYCFLMDGASRHVLANRSLSVFEINGMFASLTALNVNSPKLKETYRPLVANLISRARYLVSNKAEKLEFSSYIALIRNLILYTYNIDSDQFRPYAHISQKEMLRLLKAIPADLSKYSPESITMLKQIRAACTDLFTNENSIQALNCALLNKINTHQHNQETTHSQFETDFKKAVDEKISDQLKNQFKASGLKFDFNNPFVQPIGLEADALVTYNGQNVLAVQIDGDKYHKYQGASTQDVQGLTLKTKFRNFLFANAMPNLPVVVLTDRQLGITHIEAMIEKALLHHHVARMVQVLPAKEMLDEKQLTITALTPAPEYDTAKATDLVAQDIEKTVELKNILTELKALQNDYATNLDTQRQRVEELTKLVDEYKALNQDCFSVKGLFKAYNQLDKMLNQAKREFETNDDKFKKLEKDIKKAENQLKGAENVQSELVKKAQEKAIKKNEDKIRNTKKALDDLIAERDRLLSVKANNTRLKDSLTKKQQQFLEGPVTFSSANKLYLDLLHTPELNLHQAVEIKQNEIKQKRAQCEQNSQILTAISAKMLTTYQQLCSQVDLIESHQTETALSSQSGGQKRPRNDSEANCEEDASMLASSLRSSLYQSFSNLWNSLSKSFESGVESDDEDGFEKKKLKTTLENTTTVQNTTNQPVTQEVPTESAKIKVQGEVVAQLSLNANAPAFQPPGIQLNPNAAVYMPKFRAQASEAPRPNQLADKQEVHPPNVTQGR